MQNVLSETQFDKMEKNIITQVTDISKALIETFKFRMLYDAKVSKKQNQKTIKALKEFREKNWDKKLSRPEAYKKYMALYQ